MYSFSGEDSQVSGQPSQPINFEDCGQDNGVRYWYASVLMQFLGYDDFATFCKKPLNKAIAACAALGIPITDNFQEVAESGRVVDYKLTRFACYLSAMNGDPRKPEVAKAQAYFAGLAEVVRRYTETVDSIDRVIFRDKLSEQERSLSGVAHQAGVVNYGYFQNAGYRGMYNMNYGDLRKLKGVDSNRSVLDFMGKRELAANLFRLSETEAKIKSGGISGQGPLENAAHEVGTHVRNIMRKNGETPEQLRPAEDIENVRKSLKSTSKEFLRIDKKKPGKKAD